MSSNLVMLLTGPLQSWGGPTPGVYERPTQPMPTSQVSLASSRTPSDTAAPMTSPNSHQGGSRYAPTAPEYGRWIITPSAQATG